MEKALWEQMKNQPLLKRIASGEEVFWLNEDLEDAKTALSKINITMSDIEDAEKRLARFAPFIKKCFTETEPQNGLIESPLTEIENMKKHLEKEYKYAYLTYLFQVNFL